MNDRSGVDYALGYSDAEFQRLIRQSEFYAEFTEDVLRRAGFKPGMRVLDIGCGAGDVSLLAARMVGPAGSVTGVDKSPESLQLARRRAEQEGFRHMRFIQADLNELDLTDSFDALIGRFVLIFLPDPSAVLQRAARHIRDGGVIAFQEMDISHSRTMPLDLPLWRQQGEWIKTAFQRAGVDVQMGSKLHAVFRGAGLPAPHMNLHARIGGADSFNPDYATAISAAMLPVMERLGVATRAEVKIETLAARLREELISRDGISILPSIIGAWTQKPG